MRRPWPNGAVASKTNKPQKGWVSVLPRPLAHSTSRMCDRRFRTVTTRVGRQTICWALLRHSILHWYLIISNTPFIMQRDLVFFFFFVVVNASLKQSAGLKSRSSRKLRFPVYVTMAQDGGKFVSPTHPPPLPPGNTPGTHFC